LVSTPMRLLPALIRIYTCDLLIDYTVLAVKHGKSALGHRRRKRVSTTKSPSQEQKWKYDGIVT